MILIGVDFHPSVQQVAYVDTETGETCERRLNHSDGEAERFYRDLERKIKAARVRKQKLLRVNSKPVLHRPVETAPFSGNFGTSLVRQADCSSK
jgi:hypothetical protein